MRTQFAVIGGGLTGLATAWALLSRGHQVIVAEQAQVGHREGGSHGSCRIFRLGYEDAEYVALAARARELWAKLEHACGEQLLHPVPQLTFGPLMAQVQDAMAAAGAACELLPAPEAATRFPGIRAPGPVLLEPASAVIAADRTLAGLSALARRGGVILPGARVTSLADDGRRVRVTVESAGTWPGAAGPGVIEADRAIVCAGPWTAGLLATAGIRLPGSATLEQVAYLEPAGAAGQPMPIFVHYGGEFPYGLPVPGSPRYKIGLHHGGPAVAPDHQDHGGDGALAARIEGAARSILPGFDPHPASVERCVYDNSPDGDFVVDRIGNVVIGSGTSGHGFKFGPLIGEWLAFLAISDAQAGVSDAGPAGAPPARFALSRF